MSEDLFTSTAFKELKATGLDVVEKERTTYNAVVEIDGVTFDATDIIQCCAAIEQGEDIVLTDTRMIQMLKKYGIIKSAGHRDLGGAEAGPNLHKFLTLLQDKTALLPHYHQLDWA
jgi:hypothetical protein